MTVRKLKAGVVRLEALVAQGRVSARVAGEALAGDAGRDVGCARRGGWRAHRAAARLPMWLLQPGTHHAYRQDRTAGAQRSQWRVLNCAIRAVPA